MKCGQVGCDNDAAYRFTWPGQDEKGICTRHVGMLKEVAQGLGLHLQIIPLVAESNPPGRGFND